MTDHAAETAAGPALYIAAASALIGWVLTAVFLATFVFGRLAFGLPRDLGSFSLIGALAAAPIAFIASLFARCQACDRLVIPLLFDGKSLFFKAPNAWVLGKTVVSVTFRGQGTCPHCGAEAHV